MQMEEYEGYWYADRDGYEIEWEDNDIAYGVLRRINEDFKFIVKVFKENKKR